MPEEQKEKLKIIIDSARINLLIGSGVSYGCLSIFSANFTEAVFVFPLKPSLFSTTVHYNLFYGYTDNSFIRLE